MRLLPFMISLPVLPIGEPLSVFLAMLLRRRVDTWKIVVLLPTAILTRSLKSWFAPAVSMNKSGIRLLLLFLKRILKKQKNLTKNSFFLSQIPQNVQLYYIKNRCIFQTFFKIWQILRINFSTNPNVAFSWFLNFWILYFISVECERLRWDPLNVAVDSHTAPYHKNNDYFNLLWSRDANRCCCILNCIFNLCWSSQITITIGRGTTIFTSLKIHQNIIIIFTILAWKFKVPVHVGTFSVTFRFLLKFLTIESFCKRTHPLMHDFLSTHCFVTNKVMPLSSTNSSFLHTCKPRWQGISIAWLLHLALLEAPSAHV